MVSWGLLASCVLHLCHLTSGNKQYSLRCEIYESLSLLNDNILHICVSASVSQSGKDTLSIS